MKAAAAVALLLCAAASTCLSQEGHYPELPEHTRDAELIVTARLDISFKWPWFDGWHFRGALDATETLKGKAEKGPIALSWVEPYRSGCMRTTQLSDFDGREGFWFLRRTDEKWELRGSGWSFPFLPLEDREKLVQELRVASSALAERK